MTPYPHITLAKDPAPLKGQSLRRMLFIFLTSPGPVLK